MLMAARKLQGIGMVLLVLLFALTLYPVSLKVAATRSELTSVEADILRTRQSIRYLETEFSARASMRQLERWNAQSFGYAAPTAAQFLPGERALASLGSLAPVTPRAAAPVLLAVAVDPQRRTGGPLAGAGAAILSASLPAAQAREPAPSPSQAQPRRSSAPVRVALAATADAVVKPAANRPATGRPSDRPAPRAAAPVRVAQLDTALLSSSALSAIDRAARAEGEGRGR